MDHVVGYLDDLEEIVEALDLALEASRRESMAGRSSEVEQSTQQVALVLERLVGKVAERDALLASPTAPQVGSTLTEKLRRAGESSVAARCQAVSGQMGLVHQRALSLFVCQYHLADLSGELVSLITATPTSGTYTDGNRGERGGAAGSQQRSNAQGALFDDAA